MRIDSHVHFWKYTPEDYSWIDDSMMVIQKDFLPEDLAPILDNNKIEGCIAVQAVQAEADTDFLLQLAQQNKFVKGVVGWVDLTSSKVEERLRHFSTNSFFKGVRHTVYDERGEFMENPDFQKGISLLKNFGLTYDLLVFDYQLPGAINLVSNFPNQKFVLDHLGKPKVSQGISKDWSENIKALSKFPNVYCKISGLFSEAENFKWDRASLNPFMEIAFREFGVERILFGSNWPVCLCAANYPDTYQIIENYLNHDKELLQLVLGGNSQKFYEV